VTDRIASDAPLAVWPPETKVRLIAAFPAIDSTYLDGSREFRI
jgi:hypothetical protein